MINKETKLAYLAGALDGDGSFSLIKGTSHSSVSPLYYPMIQLANSKKELVDLFVNEFGGRFGVRKSYKGKDGGIRLPSYYWKVEKSPRCLPILENLIPYLVVKKERACLLRSFIINNPFIRGSNRLSDSLLMQREKSYLKMRSFNDNPNINGELLSKSRQKDSNSEVFWAYVAGLMDTDGSFSLKREIRKKPIYVPVISLTMADCRAVYFISNNFSGGNICIVKAKTAINGFCYRFSITARKVAEIFLRKCIPFLTIKKDIAKELLRDCGVKLKSYGRAGIPFSQTLFRQNIYETIKELNYGVYKSSLIVLKTLPDNAEGNKEQAGNEAVQLERSKREDILKKDDAVL